MDAILGQPTPVVLEKIPVKQETKDALLGQETIFTPSAHRAHEAAEWDEIERVASRFDVRSSTVAESHWRAMHWAHEVSRGL